MPTVSVVMTTYKRDPLLQRTLRSIQGAEIIVVDDAADLSTEHLCWPVARYIPRVGRPEGPFSGPSVPINIGLKAATGDIVILQNAECEHVSNVVDQMRERVKESTALFAKVASLAQDGSFDRWYCAPQSDERPYFFCGAMLRKHFLEVGGMDEAFTGYGYDDEDFAVRLKKTGIRFEYADDIQVNHQWHERPACDLTPMQQLYVQKHGWAFA